MIENLPNFILRPLVLLTRQWVWLADYVNSLAINRLVNVCRHRPHPWSTAHDYVSWTSLSDQRWSARHLPAASPVESPDPEVLAELFSRGSKTQGLCPKSTCLFPAFAQYLTDGFIRTRMNDLSKGENDSVRLQNTSNHQIDLCPLYGRTTLQTSALRTRDETSGRRGRMKSQILEGEEYAMFLFDNDGRIREEFEDLDPPLGVDVNTTPEIRARLFAFGGDRANAVPQVAMLNTLFLREHNRLANAIELAHPTWDDEQVFQTARNVVIVLFIKIVVEEYINHISPAPFEFKADPKVAWDAPWNKPNWITTEFSLLYRWHSLIPDVIQWQGNKYPIHKTFFNNSLLLAGGLVGAFADMSAQPAGLLGAFNTTSALLPVEIRAIQQGRLARLTSYSDYRNYAGLSRPSVFEDISSNPRTIALLSRLYENPDKVEFYIGLFAEEPIKNSPLPPLILRMVAVDAFSQALTNPLLSKAVFKPETFSAIGWDTIQNTSSLKDVLVRNSAISIDGVEIGMTRKDWTFEW